MIKKGLLIYILLLGFIFIPKNVFALSLTGNATVARSAVMDTSNNYYYTAWTSLSSNSLNSVPIPTSQGNYYHMGSEYVISVTLNGETTFNGHVRIPVVSNTIYNYQLMNGLNQDDFKFGFHQNFGVYNITLSNWSYNWECQTYPHLGVAHNYCYYDADFEFTLSEPLTGGYNFNFAVLNTNGIHSSYYYSGYDSNGNAIEFPVSAQNSGYANLAPSVRLNGSSGSGSSDTDTEEIIGSITDSTQQLQETITESYENLVKSQEVCIESYINHSYISIEHSILNTNGTVSTTTNTSTWYYTYGTTDYISFSTVESLTTNYNIPVCFYDSSKVFISCSSYSNFVVPDNAKFLRASMQIASNVNRLLVKDCQNGNQAIADNIMNDTIDSLDTTSLDDIGGNLTTDTPITDLLALPITLLSAIVNGVGGTCSSFSLGSLWGVGLQMPCIDPELYLGSTLWNVIDLLFCGFMIYNIAQLMIHDFDSLSSAEDLFEETYTPRHEKMRRSK